jgi:hypothetical protein
MASGNTSFRFIRKGSTNVREKIYRLPKGMVSRTIGLGLSLAVASIGRKKGHNPNPDLFEGREHGRLRFPPLQRHIQFVVTFKDFLIQPMRFGIGMPHLHVILP